MNWIESIRSAIDFIEDHITEELTADDIAKQAYVSSFYFQKAFSLLCGFTVGEYIRQRRLTLAGSELIATDDKIIDIGLKYGYDSPDSFTKAFTRFHGVTPTAVRRDGAMLKSFAPLKIKFSLEGGLMIDYKIVEKEAFTVMGASKMIPYDSAFGEIPKFWDEHYQSGNGKIVNGMFGICLEDGGKDEFEYLIADNYLPWNDVPEGFACHTIPKFTWAVFPCKGPLPSALQNVNKKIFSEWFPNCKEYELVGGYNVEMYTPACDFEGGTQNPNYYCEIWIPVVRK